MLTHLREVHPDKWEMISRPGGPRKTKEEREQAAGSSSSQVKKPEGSSSQPKKADVPAVVVPEKEVEESEHGAEPTWVT